jgi:hypothetical protein
MSVSNEGYFTLEVETVFPPYLPSQSSGVNYICRMALSAHASLPLEVMLKSISNEGYFTLQAETVLHPSQPRIAVGYMKYSTTQYLRMPYLQCKLR